MGYKLGLVVYTLQVGYLAYTGGALTDQLIKAQDTITVCAAVPSQYLALKALQVMPR